MDVKLIAATQADLNAYVSEGRFRADLYHRLAVILLHIPPLRERGEDMLVLAQAFLRQYAEAHRLIPKQLSPEAEAWLQSYAWPGNVRELSHLIERVTLLHPEVVLDAASIERLGLVQPQPAAPVGQGAVQGDSEPQDEPTRIRQALIQSGGNVVRAARLLGLSRDAVRYRALLLQVSIFLVALLVLALRRPDALLNAQFYAEDGKYWYEDQKP